MKFLQRLREPSTMAGLAGLAGLVGANPSKVNIVMAGVLSLLAVLLPEKGRGE